MQTSANKLQHFAKICKFSQKNQHQEASGSASGDKLLQNTRRINDFEVKAEFEQTRKRWTENRNENPRRLHDSLSAESDSVSVSDSGLCP